VALLRARGDAPLKHLVFLVSLLLAAPSWAAVQFAANGASTVTSGTGTCTPATTTLGTVGATDIVLLVVTGEHDRNNHALTTANGFVQIGATIKGGDGDATEENPEIGFSVWWVRGSSWTAAPVVTDTGDHTSCALHRFTGAVTSGDPWDVNASGNDSNANDTSANIPGATTTVANTYVVLVQGTSNNATATTNCGAVTNANLVDITERFDSTNTSGLGGGHCIVTGTKHAIGAYATSTLTMSATTYKGAFSIALKPAVCATNICFDSFSTLTGVDPSWTHTPLGTPKGVLVWAVTVTGDVPVSVTYGGTAMALVATADHSTGETGAVHAYFLGSSVPTGAQTIAIDAGASGAAGYAVSLTATTDTEVLDSDATINSDSVADPSVTLSLAGRSAFAAIGFKSGQDDVTGIAPNANWTAQIEEDAGISTVGVYIYDVVSTADVTAGWTQTADDAIAVAVAVAEVQEAPACTAGLNLTLLGVGGCP